jgi:protein gp37
LNNWKKVRTWNNHAGRDAVRPRVFCASLADWLDAEVPVEWLRDLLVLIQTNPHLDWLLLTKRPENWSDRLHAAFQAGWDGDEWASHWLDGAAPDNVWVGTTVEDQTRADERIPRLVEIPACVRFLSCEPLLGPVTLNAHVDWVICGGESGPGARVMEADWATNLREQCSTRGIAFWMKQMGGLVDSRHELADIPEPLRVRELPTAAE